MNLQALKTSLDTDLSAVTKSPEQVTAERNLLLKYFLNITVEDLYADPHREIALSSNLEALQNAVQQRVQGHIPIQHILGEASFFGLTFEVSPQVLIPRPETELLVEKAIERCKQYDYHRVLDLGTGSGCIAISLKKALPSLDVTAVDISPEALALARRNAEKHHATVRWLQGSWFTPVADECFDLIVSNPPYIPRSLKHTLTPEVMQEPHGALFSPEAPETLYQELMQGALKHLTPKGSFVFEMGIGQAEALVSLARAFGFEPVVYNDYAGIARIIIGIK